MHSRVCRQVLVALTLPLAGLTGCGAPAEELGDEGETGTLQEELEVCAASALPIVAATASSSESAALGAANAVDGNASTRWSSAFSDPQWLQVDLGAQRQISRVVLSWETAASSAYTIQVSNNGSSWTTVSTRSNAPAGPRTDDITGLDSRARYVRMHSTQRTTAWGNSLYELKVYGDSDPSCGTYHIDAVHSGKSLDVTGVSTADGAYIQQWSYGGGDNQKWTLVPKGNSEYQLKSVLSGKCIDIQSASTANGARAQQWTCHEGKNQRFMLSNVGGGQYALVAAHSGKCLDVTSQSTANGGSIQQWDCGGGNNQKWRLAALAPSTTRKWASYDANGDGVWNWSTTVSTPGGSTFTGGNQYGDIPVNSPDLGLTFDHTGTYAAANLTTGYSAEGLEAQSQAERDAGKAVDGSGTLSFVYKSTSASVRLKLIDASGAESKSVRVSDYASHCAIYNCDVDIPLSALTKTGFNFGAVKSVTFFVDNTLPNGFYSAYVARVVFRATGARIDVESDPNNCGSVGRSCLGGACRDGACQAVLVASDFVCSSSMTASDTNFWVGDNGSIYRYDISGSNKTQVVSNSGFSSNLIRNGSRLFWTGGTDSSQVHRLDDGASSVATLYSNSAQWLHLTGSNLVAYDTSATKYVTFGTSGGTPSDVVTLGSSVYPFVSAATSTHVYYAHGDSTGVWLKQVNRSTGATTVISNPGDSIYSLTAYGDTVYWTYNNASSNTGVRKLSSAAGSTVQQAVAEVPSTQRIGNAFVDASGIYHSWYNGVTEAFYRTSHTNAAERTLVSKGVYPYDSAVLTSDSIVWLQSCNRGGPGYVHRLAKP